MIFLFDQTTLADSASTHRISVKSASELDYPPLAIVLPDGTAGGFSVDLLKAAAKAVGVSVSFKVGPWHEIKQDLKEQKLDVLPLVSYSRERDELFDFTTPYLTLNGTVFVRKDNTEIRHISDLKGKELLVMRGDTAHEYVSKEKLSDTIILLENYEDAFQLLSSGKHDAVVVQQIVGLQIIRKLNITNVVPVEQKYITTLKPNAMKLEGFEQKFCFAVSEGNHQLLSLLNEGLAIVSIDGSYNALYEQWFAAILPSPEISLKEVLHDIFTALVPILLVLALVVLWYLRLLVSRRTKHLELEIKHRQEIEDSLADANAKYIKAQELGKVGNWEYNISTQEFWGSTEAKRIYGFSAESLSFTTEEVENCIPEKEIIHKALENLIEKDIAYNLEFDIITRDTGERRTIMSIAELERDTSGNPYKIKGLIQDITERKKTENALRESEELHRALVEGLPDIVMRFDRYGRHLFVSENVCEIVDMQAEQFIGRTHRELGFPEDRCIFWETAIKKVFNEDVPLEIEYSFEGRQGEVINNWRLLPEHDKKGFVASVLSLNRDITAHRKAENNYQLLFREMLGGFALHDIIYDNNGRPIDYRFLAVNPSFERITGLNEENIVGRTVLEIMPDTKKDWIDAYGKVALTGEPIYFEKYSAVFHKYFEISAFKPAPNQFACIFNDITERKRAEEEKELLRSQLVQAQKMEAIGTLAGGIAHDFNNILSAMLGYAELVKADSPKGSLASRDLEKVLLAGNRAKELVQQILAFSRQSDAEMIPLKPGILINEIITLLRSSLPTTIDIELDIDKDCGMISANPTQIHQVVMNLCANAFHAMEGNCGVLSISLKKITLTDQDLAAEVDIQPGEFVQLSVKDTGAGIEPENIKKIFDPYFTTKERGKGTGMGLAITHGIVKKYGGFINCESQKGRGTVFYINLPATEKRVAPKVGAVQAIFDGTERILLIDDETMLAEMGRTMLERLGYTVTISTNSLAALAAFTIEPDEYDLVITDYTMPGLTGLDLARRMLRIRPGLPIILCTGYSSQLTEERVKDIGIKGFALKPLTQRDIAGLIRSILDENIPATMDTTIL